ncbi:MAG: DsbA family protein [Prochlorothrix sp.]|nr:DsbA family protein [Prochlorothrix sp.]
MVRFYRLALSCLLGLALTGCTTLSTRAQTLSPSEDLPSDLEAQVLQIIRENPEVILESLQEYQRAQQEQQRQAQRQLFEQMTADVDQFIGQSPTLGSPDRKIVLVEFSDFQCPFCAQAQAVLKAFMDKNGDRVTLVYKHFPLTEIHPEALPAAAAAWAAQQQGQYWAFHDALFAQQQSLGEARYGEIARDLDLDLEQFDRDRTSPAALRAINQDRALAIQMGLRGTPSLFLNGNPIELPLTEEKLESLIAEL